MQCMYEIDVKEPTEEYLEDNLPFTPFVTFRLVQLNFTPKCMTDIEIDEQVNDLIREAEKMRNKVKRELKGAIARHDALMEKRRQR